MLAAYLASRMRGPTVRRRFCAYFYFVGLDCWSIGIHVCLTLPNVEIHLPFGFLRFGWQLHGTGVKTVNGAYVARRTFGVKP